MKDVRCTEEFLAFLGHEMKKSLSALHHSLDVWSRRDPEMMDDLRHSIERQVRQLTRLCDDLLDPAHTALGELDLPLWNEADHDGLNRYWPLIVPTHSLTRKPPSSYRIVIVDNDRELGESIARLLRTIGQSVTVARNGVQAIELILRNRPQVVFLNLMLGEQDGFEVACQLRKHKELDEVVLIALSGLGDQRHKRRAQDAGCNMYLDKPVGILDFVNVLHEASSVMYATSDWK